MIALILLITGLILGSIFGYRMRARQAELDVEAVRIESRRAKWECEECGI